MPTPGTVISKTTLHPAKACSISSHHGTSTLVTPRTPSENLEPNPLVPTGSGKPWRMLSITLLSSRTRLLPVFRQDKTRQKTDISPRPYQRIPTLGPTTQRPPRRLPPPLPADNLLQRHHLRLLALRPAAGITGLPDLPAILLLGFRRRDREFRNPGVHGPVSEIRTRYQEAVSR